MDEDLELGELGEFSALSPLITSIRQQVRKMLDLHLGKISHDEERKETELPLFRRIIDIVGKKWAIEVMWELEIHRQLHFNELRRHLEGITPRALSDTLKHLEANRLVNRDVMEDERPPRVCYSLSARGRGVVELSMTIFWYLLTTES